MRSSDRPGSEILTAALVAGSIASVTSTLALALAGRAELRNAVAPVNGPSQWVWGPDAPWRNRLSARHTAVGYGIHHLASVFWALLFEKLRPRRRGDVPGELAAAALTAAVANMVDMRLTPERFTPGFERRLSRPALLFVYAAFGAGLAAAALLYRKN